MRILLASTLFVACLANSAAAVSIVFQIDQLQSNLGLEVILEVPLLLPISDSDSTTLSGTIEADLGFTGTGLPADLNFTGGEIVADMDMTLVLQSLGLINLTATTTNLKAALSTLLPPDTLGIQSTTGPETVYDFDVADHEFLLNQGTVTAIGDVAFVGPVNETIDLAMDPQGGSPELGTIRTITVTDLGGGNYQAFLDMPIFVTSETPLNDEPVPGSDPPEGNGICDGDESCATFNATLNLQATAFFSLGTAFDPGDFDEDGDIDGADFLLWQRGGSPTPLSPSDLADWEAGYGTPALSGLAATIGAVPEPSSLVLLGLALGLIPRRMVKRCYQRKLRTTSLFLTS